MSMMSWKLPRKSKLLVTVWCLLVPWAVHASPCRVIDAYTPADTLSHRAADLPPADQLKAFRQGIIARYPGLYAPQVLDLSPAQNMDTLILASLASARESQTRAGLMVTLRQLVDRTQASFRNLAGFRCDFPIYLTDSLGQFDGAGRIVAGQRPLVGGVDALDGERSLIALPVFIAHEMFHRYHFMAGGFSDDDADRQPLWRTLWAEGLATYASRALTRGATIEQALMLPADLSQRAAPLRSRIAADLLAHLDQIDPDVYRTYFTYGNKAVAARGLPWRSGYYIGYLVAERLARRHTLGQLAHMPPRQVHALIRDALREMALPRT